ncbi:Hypothetical predicted protein [Pelobates cultripes]|uniref:Uncharacterized protein n=1 Tax=Pelobates cultripes TaxID=61616 RepID=A0AAD1WY92_PELCU|nr:Hypothetical predicted protein [Pelobates cultripes]
MINGFLLERGTSPPPPTTTSTQPPPPPPPTTTSTSTFPPTTTSTPSHLLITMSTTPLNVVTGTLTLLQQIKLMFYCRHEYPTTSTKRKAKTSYHSNGTKR